MTAPSCAWRCRWWCCSAAQSTANRIAASSAAKRGETKSLAVSNFSPAQLDVVLAAAKAGAGAAARPTVNQLRLAPGEYGRAQTTRLLAENAKRGVLVQAWSPLRKALSGGARDACEAIGRKYGKSAAQVGLRFIADSGAAFTTQTKTKAHFAEDIDIFDFSLTPEEVATLARI